MGLGGRTPAEAAGVVTAKAARGKYGSLIRMAATKNRQIASKLGPLNEKAKISVDEDCTKIVPKGWLENDEWRKLHEIATGLDLSGCSALMPGTGCVLRMQLRRFTQSLLEELL